MKVIESLLGLGVKESYHIRPLTEEDMMQMHRTFEESFSDYAVPYNLTLEEFTHKMLHKVHISFEHSFGAFSNQKLVGFVFQSINSFEGIQMAYNAGTGVLPGHRGKQIPALIYKHIIPILVQQGIEKCVLEVLEENERAINVYKQIGFGITKKYSCLQINEMRSVERNVITIESTVGDLKRYTEMSFGSTSFGDTNEQLAYNIQYENTLEASINGMLVGYLVFQPELGRVTQFGVHKDHRRTGVGSELFARANSLCKKKLTVININEEYEGVITFLESIGFERTLGQFEMQLAVNRL